MVTEIVPMEFSEDYAISALITREDETIEIPPGDPIIINPGDEVLITVTNKYTPKPFFKGQDWLRNIFG
jgi:hypothetical protein